MEEYSYSDSDGDGVMVCNAWNPETVSVTFTWKKSDGSALVAEADKVYRMFHRDYCINLDLYQGTSNNNDDEFQWC